MGRSSYDGSDFAESEQLVGARRGLVRPEAVRVVSQRAFQPGFPIWTDCRPHDGVHGAARPVGQLVNTSQHVNGSHFGDPWGLCPRRSRRWSLRPSRSETPLPDRHSFVIASTPWGS